MTTTADKIKPLSIEELEKESAKAAALPEPFGPTLARLFAEIAKHKREMDNHIKPTDPEPLECWANVHRHTNGIETYVRFYPTAAEANVASIDPIGRRKVYMREVTPQMKQDEKDAKRYKELLYAVRNKYPGESRHETALRYIIAAEQVNNQEVMEKS